MSPLTLLEREALISFPRVSGDEPQKVTTEEMNQLFSPRERG